MGNFEAEVEACRARLPGDERWKAVYSLRGIEEAWARCLLGLGESGRLATQVRDRVEAGVDARVAAQAEAHLAAAEGWQGEIGSWATGAGEGLNSMAEVHELNMARAWLAAAMAQAKRAPQRHARTAHELVASVEGDPNGQGRPHAKSIAALRLLLRSLANESRGY